MKILIYLINILCIHDILQNMYNYFFNQRYFHDFYLQYVYLFIIFIYIYYIDKFKLNDNLYIIEIIYDSC